MPFSRQVLLPCILCKEFIIINEDDGMNDVRELSALMPHLNYSESKVNTICSECIEVQLYCIKAKISGTKTEHAVNLENTKLHSNILTILRRNIRPPSFFSIENNISLDKGDIKNTLKGVENIKRADCEFLDEKIPLKLFPIILNNPVATISGHRFGNLSGSQVFIHPHSMIR